MAQTSYPFDTQSVTEDQWSAMMSTAQETRAVTGLAPYGDSSGRQVKVTAGTAWVRGHFYSSTAEEILAIGANSSGNPRIDTIVLTLDPATNSIVVAVVAGTAAAAPVPPTLTQTGTGVYQHPLADVAVANGAATITAANVTPRARITTTSTGRNILANGSFQVAQRGTSFTSATTPANSDDTYLLDRWVLLSDGNDIVDVTQSTGPTGFPAAISLDVETGNKKFGILQVVEAKDCAPVIDGTATLQFRAKVTGTSISDVKAAVISWSGTADTVTSDVVSAWGASGTAPTLAANWTYENTPVNLNVTTGWAAYTVTAAVDTASTANVAVLIWCDDATTTVSDVLHLSGAQLEAGSTATGYEHKPRETELAECQRHFQKSYAQGVVPGASTVDGACVATTIAVATRHFIATRFPVVMRTSPAVTVYSQDGTSGAISLYTDSATKLTGASLTGTSDASVGAYISTSGSGVEHQRQFFHFTASADL